MSRTYYSFNGANIAVREQSNVTNTLSWLYGDHLGSASLTTDDSGALRNTQRYLPFGEVRYTSGGALPTDLTFQSQRAESAALGSLMDFKARNYSPIVGRFLSPDTIVPGSNPQALNRFSFVRNNPLNRVDPTGHVDDCAGLACGTVQIGNLIRVLTVPAYRPKEWKGFDTSNLDVTQELLNQMKMQACDSCSEVVNTRNAFNQSWDQGMEHFVSIVRANGMFDFKPEFNKKGITEVTIGGRTRRFDEIGRAHV